MFTPQTLVDYKHFPKVLFVTNLLLAVIGIYFVTSAISFSLAKRQALYLIAGLVVMAVAARLDLQLLAGYSFYFYCLGLLSLLLLPVLGIRINNAVRWYDLRVFRVQPSEFVKLALVLVLAEHLRYNRNLHRLHELAVLLALTIIPMMLIVIEPDLGTSLLFLPLFFGMAFLAGARARHLGIIFLVLAALGVAGWFTPGVLKEYQKKRILAFLDSEKYSQTAAGYNGRQAVLAITAGGMDGSGWGKGALNKRIPERHTDFIFPVIAEEWGFVRTTAFILLYLTMLTCICLVAMRARDPFGRLLVTGIFILLSTQACLHIAISLRLAPITGLTLPLISYGGSSLVATLTALGLVINVATNKPFVFASEELRQ